MSPVLWMLLGVIIGLVISCGPVIDMWSSLVYKNHTTHEHQSRVFKFRCLRNIIDDATGMQVQNDHSVARLLSSAWKTRRLTLILLFVVTAGLAWFLLMPKVRFLSVPVDIVSDASRRMGPGSAAPVSLLPGTDVHGPHWYQTTLPYDMYCAENTATNMGHLLSQLNGSYAIQKDDDLKPLYLPARLIGINVQIGALGIHGVDPPRILTVFSLSCNKKFIGWQTQTVEFTFGFHGEELNKIDAYSSVECTAVHLDQTLSKIETSTLYLDSVDAHAAQLLIADWKGA